MTRFCAKCRKLLGEKCPECQKEVYFGGTDEDGHVLMRCETQGCVVGIFRLGEFGPTHGMCNECAVGMYGQKLGNKSTSVPCEQKEAV